MVRGILRGILRFIERVSMDLEARYKLRRNAENGPMIDDTLKGPIR